MIELEKREWGSSLERSEREVGQVLYISTTSYTSSV